jgi:hypothetical protein
MGNNAPGLMPCPFCGAELERDEDGAQHPGDDCVLSQVYIFDTNLHEWNRRTGLSSPLAGVKVKPLVWEQLGRSYRAKAPLFGNIRVESYFADKWSIYWSAPGYTDLFTHGEHDTPDAAKAAAQADYDARIRAAMEAPDDAAMLRTSATVLMDLLEMRGSYHESMQAEFVQKLWDDVKDAAGYSAVRAFLAALAALKGSAE